MSPSALLRLFVALLALALAWVARDILSTRANKPELLFPTAPEAARLSVGTVSLEKTEGEWRLSAPFAAKADPEKVRRFLEKLAAARLSAVLAEDSAKHDLFGVTESSGLRLKAETPKGAALDVVVGRQGASPGTFFVRWPGADAVREAAGLGRWEVSEKPGDWADTTAAVLDPTRITVLELRWKGAKPLTLLQRGAAWRVNGEAADVPAELVQKEIQPILTTFARFELDGVSPSTRTFTPELSILVETLTQTGDASEVALAMDVSPLDPKTYRHLARVKGREPLLFEASPFRLEPFRLKAADLK